MKISFENADKVNGLMTLTVEAEDYKKQVEDKLKEYRKKANVPGFRPGMVPMGLIKRQYGTAVKVDVINQVLGQEMYKYINDNKIKMLGEPMPSEKQVPQDLEGDGPFEFVFDIAVAPEFTISLSDKDKVTYYDIQADDELVNSQIDMMASRSGHYEKVEDYDESMRDMLKGDLRQLDEEGNTLEGGITVADAVLMPQYIKVEDQKKLFDGAHLGDIITFNPKKAYPESDAEVAGLLKMKKEEVADLTSDFSFQITEISRFVKAEVNKDLFEGVYPGKGIETEQQFRDAIAKGLKAQFATDSDYKFLQDLRKYAEEKVGDLTFPEAILKRVMLQNNQDKGADFVEKNFDASIKELKWHLIREKLAEANGVKIEDADVTNAAKEMARAQFAQYGMNDVPEEYLENYAKEMLKKRETVDNLVERAIDHKLTLAVKDVVKLDKKSVTLDEFNKLFSE